MPVESLDDVKSELQRQALWMAEHDGRINAYWEAQHKLNDVVAKKFHTFGLRLDALERRVLYMAGGASALGAVAGVLIARLI